MSRETMPYAWRDLLIEHIDGPVSLDIVKPARGAGATLGARADHYGRVRTLDSLINRGWIVLERATPPTFSKLTEAGRDALTAALANWADAICRSRVYSDLLPGVVRDPTETEKFHKTIEATFAKQPPRR